MNNVANEFQKLALEGIGPILAKRGVEPSFVDAGEGERYLFFSDETRNLKIWIYENEVAYWLGSFQVQCETQDFDSQSEMIRFWASSLDQQLSEQSRGQ